MPTITHIQGSDLITASRAVINTNFDNLNAAIVPGTSINWRGAWSNSTTYAVNDAVSFSGSSYIAIAINTNQQPDISPLSWNLMAMEGATGPAGPTGPTGPQGPPGTPGYTTVENNGTPVAQEPKLNLIPGTNVTLSVVDNPGSTRTDVTINATSEAADFYQTVENNGTPLAQEPKLNLIPGSGVTLTIADNPGSTRTDVTIAASGSSGYNTIEKSGVSVAQEPFLNFIPGTGVLITVADNAGSTRTDTTISADAAFIRSIVYGDALTTPTISMFPTTNQSASATSISFTNDTTSGEQGVILSANSTTNDTNIVARLMTVPATPYNIRMRYRFTAPTVEQYPLAGFCWSDGTKFAVFGNMSRNDIGRIRTTTFNNTTSFSGSYDVEKFAWSGWPGRNGLFDIYVSDNGTNRICTVIGTGILGDKIQYDSRVNTSFFTPTQIGIFIAPGNNNNGNVYPLQIKVIDWTQS
jgi:hypothetical protein